MDGLIIDPVSGSISLNLDLRSLITAVSNSILPKLVCVWILSLF